MYFVYIVKCRHKKKQRITFYTGYTKDPRRRAREHIKGNKLSAKYLRGRTVLEFRVIKCFKNRGNAMKYENKVKRQNQNKKIELFNNSIYYRYIPEDINKK